MKQPSAFLAVLERIGRRMFGVRLFVGLAAVLLSIEWLEPTPLFAPQHRGLQLAGLALIALGWMLRAWGAGSAGRHTRAATIEAPHLVTSGPFAYVRNPIYAGTIVLAVGMVLLIGDARALFCTCIALGVLYFFIVPAEEAFLRAQFGAEYLRYCEAVPRLIPRLQPWQGHRERPFQWRSVRSELMILLWLVLIYGALQFEEYLDRIGIS